MTRDALTRYLHDYLSCDAFADYAPNGLQVEGKAELHRICTAVTASQVVIEEAIHQKADALIVHHGYFWRGEASPLLGMKRERIAALLRHDMNLYAYHLPLDCHLELGNNVQLGQRLGLEGIKTHTAGKTNHLLWSGVLSKPLAVSDFAHQINQRLQRMPLWVSGTDKPISRVAWCSGAAQDLIEEAHQLGVDAYISGEISERTYYQAKELGIHYLACGHHATERFGVQALGQHVQTQFGLVHEFIDSHNPI